MGLGGTPSLDRVLIRSQNTTIQHMIIEGSDHAEKLHIKDNLGNTIFKVDTVTPAVTFGASKIVGDLIIYDPTETEFAIISRTLAGLDIDAGVGSNALGLGGAGSTDMLLVHGQYARFDFGIRPFNPGVQTSGRALFPWGDVRTLSVTIDDPTLAESSKISRSLDYLIIKADVGATGVLIEDGHLGFKAVNKGRIVDGGTSLQILYGAGPDQGLGLGCCSGALYYLDIDDNGLGRIDIGTENMVINDGAFVTTSNFLDIQGYFRTSGHVLNVVGDVAVLTTGDLMRVYNNPAGVGPTYVFAIDKNGKISVGDSTGAEHATFERTLLDFIIDTGIGAGLSIRIAGSEVIGDNGVSALELGNTTIVPQLPVLTTAQRNALTATQGMIIWHLGPPSRAETYTGVGWVAL